MNKVKVASSVLVLSLSVVLTGCALAPGAHLDPDGKSAVDFNLIDINEKVVLDEPVSRQRLVDEPGVEGKDNYEYLIGPHDVLGIRVWNNPDLSSSMTMTGSPIALTNQVVTDPDDIIKQRSQVTPDGVEVQSDGRFFYPFAGNIQAAGKTVSWVRSELSKQLSKFVKDPQVSVRVQEFNSQQAQILGEVKYPRPLPITSKPMRILDAISLAGGLNDNADKVEAVLIRDGMSKSLNLAELLDGDMSQNYILKDDDVLNIDTNRYRQIVIMGEVNRPTAMPYDPRGMSLNDALVTASGINQMYSNAKGVYILRNESKNGKPSIYRLDMKNATGLLLADRFPLKARDVVYVDTAGVTRWNRVINQIIPTTQFIDTANGIQQ